MERLTKIDGQGRLLAYTINDTGLPAMITHGNAYRELIEKLKAYEDTGLEPEQIQEIDKLYAEKCRELAELRKQEPFHDSIFAIMRKQEEQRFIRENIAKKKIKDRGKSWSMN